MASHEPQYHKCSRATIVVSSVLCTAFPAGAGAATLGVTYLPQTQARTPEGTALALSVAGCVAGRTTVAALCTALGSAVVFPGP